MYIQTGVWLQGCCRTVQVWRDGTNIDSGMHNAYRKHNSRAYCCAVCCCVTLQHKHKHEVGTRRGAILSCVLLYDLPAPMMTMSLSA